MVCLTSKKADAKLVSEALKALGKDNFALIIHGSSFPSKDGEDTGFGTFNSESGHALIDYASGIILNKKLGEEVKVGDVLATLYTNNKSKVTPAEEIIYKAYRVEKVKPQERPLILAKIK